MPEYRVPPFEPLVEEPEPEPEPEPEEGVAAVWGETARALLGLPRTDRWRW